MEKQIMFFDLETTGKSITKDRIVQIAYCLLDCNLRPAGVEQKMYINPEMPIPAPATAVNHITDEMVKDASTFKLLAPMLAQLFSNCSLAGYNIKNYDVPLLSEEFARVGIVWPQFTPHIFDAGQIFHIKERRDLASAVKFFTGQIFEDGHDAGNDTVATIEVFISQLDRYPELEGMTDEQMHVFCNDGLECLDLAGKIYLNDKGIPCYAFGKSKDIPVLQDRGFGEWMLKNDFSTNTKNILRNILA